MNKFIYILAITLALASCESNKALQFEKLDAAYTHIDFTNEIKPTDELNAFNFTNIYNGGGVGMGDFNNDGLVDIFFTGNQVSSKLYLNKGQLQFEDITAKAGINKAAWCNGVSVVDINNDGWDDIYISVAQHVSMKNSNNLLFINQKTAIPTFKEMAADYGLAYEGYSTQTVFFDYDQDNDLDAFILNTSPDTQNPNYLRPAVNDGSHPSSSKLFENKTIKNGHPFYEDVSIAAGIIYEGLGLGVVVADFNNDFLPDIYCSNDFMSSDVLYFNNGDKTFKNITKESIMHTSLSGMGVDAADLNQDGKVDIFQLDMLPEDNERQKQMLSKQDYDKKESSVNEPYNYQRQYMRNTLQLNLGNDDGQIPQFSEIGLAANIAKTDWSWGILLCDFDNDQRKDIFISNGYRKNVTDLDFISYFQGQNMFGSNDFRNKNRGELIKNVPEIPLKNYAYKNMGNLSYKNVAEDWGLDELGYANGAAYADLDNDGDYDLVINNIDNKASLFKNNNVELGKAKSIKITFKGDANNIRGLGAKVKAYVGGEISFFENYPVRSYLSSMPNAIMIGLGKHTSIDSLEVYWPGKRMQKIKNISQNLQVDINSAITIEQKYPKKKSYFYALDEILNYQHTEANYNDFNQFGALHKMYSKAGPAIAKADINHDGLQDIIIGGAYNGSETRVYLQDLGGHFKANQEITTSKNMEVGALAIFDADNDGDQDLMMAGGGIERPLHVQEAYQPQLWLNDGRGHFAYTNKLPNLLVSSSVIIPFDMDGDKDLDLFIGGRIVPNQYPLPASSFLLKNEGGKFSDVSKQWAKDLFKLGLVSDGMARDVDKNGTTDLILVGEWMPLTFFLNDGKHFEKVEKSGTEGWWNSIEVGDFNEDGLDDFIVGNEGSNTFFRANTQKSITIQAKDFDGDGKIDPLMGFYLNDLLVPVNPRENLNLQVNAFRKKFTTYKDYAQAGFEDLFSSKDLAGAYQKSVVELRTTLFLGTKNGSYKNYVFNNEAQFSPVNDLIVRDFNLDGHLDILSIGNFYPNEAHQGRQDASRGTLFLGNGKGKFKTIDFEKTGLNIQTDARKAAYFDENQVMLVFSNADKVKAYKWQNQLE